MLPPVLPGDFLGGSTFAAKHRGESVLDVLNHLDVDYFTLGNHEFDFGAGRVGELIKKSNFKWLGSNVRDAHSGTLFETVLDTDFFDVKIGNIVGENSRVESGDANDIIRVGVFGVCTQFTPMLSDPGDEVLFEDVFQHSERCVAILKSKECDYIIALTHMELENDKKIADLLDIDIIIGEYYKSSIASGQLFTRLHLSHAIIITVLLHRRARAHTLLFHPLQYHDH